MKTYTNGAALSADLAGPVHRTVWVEVDPCLLADLLGRRFRAPDGRLVSMESVSIGWSESHGRYIAEPVFLQQDPVPATDWSQEAKRLRRFLDPIELDR